MKAILKGLWVDSADYSLESFFSEDARDVYFGVNLKIGPLGSDEADDFNLLLCTPESLSKNLWMPELIRHMLIVRKYDLEEIKRTINDCIEKCTGDNWEEIAQKLSRYFAWEFEDYQPYVDNKNL